MCVLLVTISNLDRPGMIFTLQIGLVDGHDHAIECPTRQISMQLWIVEIAVLPLLLSALPED